MGGEPDYVFGFLMTIVAGFSTSIGVAFIPLVNSGLVSKAKGLAASMGFAAGVMIWLAFMGIMGKEAPEFFESHFKASKKDSDEASHQHDHDDNGVPIRLAVFGFFFLGLVATAALEVLVEVFFGSHGHGHGGGGHAAKEDVQMGEHQHQHHNEIDLDKQDGGMSTGFQNSGPPSGWGGPPALTMGTSKKSMLLDQQALTAVFVNEGPETTERDNNLMKVSVMAMLALALHNFPEGLAVFFSASTGTWTVAVGIILHNIPGGAAISIPIHRATGSYMKAISAALFAGLAQPLGAGFGWLLIGVLGVGTPTDFVYGAIYAATAGTLVAIALTGMLPEALTTASNFFVLCAVTSGFFFMEASIIITELAGGHSH